MSDPVPQIPEVSLLLPITPDTKPLRPWQTAQFTIAGVFSILFPYLWSRTALAVRVLEKKDFATNFRGGEFADTHNTHHDNYTSLRLDGAKGVFTFLKNRYVLEKAVANELKDKNVSRWEALGNLSTTQKISGLVFVGAGVFLLGAVLWPRKKQQESEIIKNKTQYQDKFQPKESYLEEITEEKGLTVSRQK
jgi:hypothetical protein